MLQKFILQHSCALIFLQLKMKEIIKRINWDALGVTTSVACAIHCALLPIFLSSLPLFGINIINNVMFEAGMIALAFAIGTFSLYHGFKRHHHHFLPLIVFAAGFVFLILKQFFLSFEIWLLLPAASLIITAHFLNYFFCRKANHCHTTDCNH
jgi:tetrahydromethanopterin S-methyltransferase subunit C